MFENINRIELDNKENITAISSAENENVPIKNCNCKGEVEEWF